MEIIDIRTRDDFIEYLKENVVGLKEASDEKLAGTADWFICVVNARLVFDSYNTKDMASLFLDGITPVKSNPIGAHREFWNTLFEDVDWNRSGEEYTDPEYAATAEKEAVESIEGWLTDFFGE